MRIVSLIVVMALSGRVLAASPPPPKLVVKDVGEAFDAAHVEFRGVAAGEFDPKHWESGDVTFVPDIRSPLLAPRDGGTFCNIYAPSVIQTADGWHLYYGGWDGELTGNDRIYRADVDSEFMKVTNRRTVIEHGDFRHVCNVSVVPAARGRGLAMACTAYPAVDGLNKPATFFSDDGGNWSAAAAARRQDLISMTGYDGFPAGDINGMNVLLAEDGKYRLYFNNFRDGSKTFRASSDDGKKFHFDRVVHEPSAIVNDVKRFNVAAGGEKWYLMGLHSNGPSLYYALSRDGTQFGKMKTLTTHAGDSDRHIVSIGWVVAGPQDDARGRRLLGFLYGAGDAPSLDRNRIFARWLQKKVTLTVPDLHGLAARALGPDRQLLPLSNAVTTRVRLEAEVGSLIGISEPVEVKPGRAYSLELPETGPNPTAPAREGTAR